MLNERVGGVDSSQNRLVFFHRFLETSALALQISSTADPFSEHLEYQATFRQREPSAQLRALLTLPQIKFRKSGHFARQLTPTRFDQPPPPALEACETTTSHLIRLSNPRVGANNFVCSNTRSCESSCLRSGIARPHDSSIDYIAAIRDFPLASPGVVD